MNSLLTGASGFLGRYIAKYLVLADGLLIRVGKNLASDIVCDLSLNIPEFKDNFSIVIHAAGKAHLVPKNAEEKEDFFKVNVQGTENLLVALEQKKVKKFVFISSSAVYGLTEGYNINEDKPLLATEAYGHSKILAEKLITDWCTKKNIEYYILRLPLIAGKNAPGNLGAMVNGIKSGRYLSIGKGEAKKSMVLADDVARFITNIQGPSGVYNLTDGYHPSFNELEKAISAFYKKKRPRSIPVTIAKMVGFAGDIVGANFPLNSEKLKKITNSLTFDDTKARALLQWKPREVLEAWDIE